MRIALNMSTTTQCTAALVWRHLKLGRGSGAAQPLQIAIPPKFTSSRVFLVSYFSTGRHHSLRMVPARAQAHRPPARTWQQHSRRVCAADPRRRAREGLRCRARSRAEQGGPLRSR